MTTGISGALNAYQQALSRIGTQIPQQPKASEQNTDNFKNMVVDAVSNAVETSKRAENLSTQAIAGKADIQDVVLAVSNAELALETVVAVRDTAVKAYKEIMSMPI